MTKKDKELESFSIKSDGSAAVFVVNVSSHEMPFPVVTALVYAGKYVLQDFEVAFGSNWFGVDEINTPTVMNQKFRLKSETLKAREQYDRGLEADI